MGFNLNVIVIPMDRVAGNTGTVHIIIKNICDRSYYRDDHAGTPGAIDRAVIIAKDVPIERPACNG